MTDAYQAGVLPLIKPVQAANIPEILKQEKRWLGWWPGPIKANGKFDKYPVHPQSGHKIDPVDPENWLTFDEAMDAHKRDLAKGVGIVLSADHTIFVDGEPMYLTAIDLDQCGDKMAVHKALWIELGKPYVETSPSGAGLRMLGLCTTPVKGGNSGDGRELYSTGRFMTITGHSGRGMIRDITRGVAKLDHEWFGDRVLSPSLRNLPTVQPTRPETSDNVAQVQSMLDAMSSDIGYDDWRNIMWALASTGWENAREMAHEWSKRAPDRYDADTVDGLFDSFDPARGISLGTLVHHARQSGWAGAFDNLEVVQPERSRLMTADQLRKIPASPFLVRGVLPAQGVAALYGEPGTCKSFIALDLAHAVSAGLTEWFGFPVRNTPVVYVPLEGQGGVSKRLTALEKHSKQACSDRLRFWCFDIQMLTHDGIDALAADIVEDLGKGAVVIIDTLNQASPGADENSSQDMGRIISSAKRLAAAVGGLVILVHHAGKDRSRGLRGHSSLLAAMDAVIEVVNDKGLRSWSIRKSKDDTGDIVRDFQLVPYEVGEDDYGPITSCAIQPTFNVRTPERKPPTGKNQIATLAELQRWLTGDVQRIEYSESINHVAANLGVAKAKDRAKEAIDALIRQGHLSLSNGGIALA